MGKTWVTGGQSYEDCDHCGLSFNVRGNLKDNHVDGACISVYGPAHTRVRGKPQESETKTYGADTQAGTWRTRGLKIGIVESTPNEASGGIVVPPTPSHRKNPVEKERS